MPVHHIAIIVFAAIGFLTGVAATFWSLTHTAAGHRERRFVRHATAIGWFTIVIYVLLLLIIPAPWVWLFWAPYGVLIPLGLVACHRIRFRIRREEREESGRRGAAEFD